VTNALNTQISICIDIHIQDVKFLYPLQQFKEIPLLKDFEEISFCISLNMHIIGIL